MAILILVVAMPLDLLADQYAPGDPFAAVLMTDDIDGATRFYSRPFGWTFEHDGGAVRAGRG